MANRRKTGVLTWINPLSVLCVLVFISLNVGTVDGGSFKEVFKKVRASWGDTQPVAVASTAAPPAGMAPVLVPAEAPGLKAGGLVNPEDSTAGPENDTTEGEELRYHVAKFDFGYVGTNLLVAIWVLFVSLAKVGFHSTPGLTNLFPESVLLIIIGVILGVILYFANAGDYQLNTHTFFLIILPPIILDAGYFMPTRSFFDNLGSILWYAVINTLVNTLWIGFSLWGVSATGGFPKLEHPPLLLHCLVLAALLAAVDPVAVLAVFDAVQVNEVLYIVVFGESLLNDGIAVVLYHLFEGFADIEQQNIEVIDVVAGVGSFVIIVLGSPSIGMLLAFCAGFISRFTKHVRIMEPVIILVIGYMAFLIAEMFHLSGILSCTFCGITMRKYVEVRISQKSQICIRYVLKVLASVAESIIFMYLGISCVNRNHEWDTAFCLLTLVFCLIYRPLGVVVLTWLCNLFRQHQLNYVDQFIMSYGGLRGAIAFALCILLSEKVCGSAQNREIFITSTILVIYFTNIVMGTTVRPLVNLLKVKLKNNDKETMNEKIAQRFTDHVMCGIEAVMNQHGYNRLRAKFSIWNNKVLKPLIVGKHECQQQGYELLNVHRRLSEKDARRMSRVPSVATDVHKLSMYMRRMSTMSGNSGSNPAMTNRAYQRSMSEAHIYERGLWSLPSFTVEGRAGQNNMNSNGSFHDQGRQFERSGSVDGLEDRYDDLQLHNQNFQKPRNSVDGSGLVGRAPRKSVSFIGPPNIGDDVDDNHWGRPTPTNQNAPSSAIQFTANRTGTATTNNPPKRPTGTVNEGYVNAGYTPAGRETSLLNGRVHGTGDDCSDSGVSDEPHTPPQEPAETRFGGGKPNDLRHRSEPHQPTNSVKAPAPNQAAHGLQQGGGGGRMEGGRISGLTEDECAEIEEARF